MNKKEIEELKHVNLCLVILAVVLVIGFSVSVTVTLMAYNTNDKQNEYYNRIFERDFFYDRATRSVHYANFVLLDKYCGNVSNDWVPSRRLEYPPTLIPTDIYGGYYYHWHFMNPTWYPVMKLNFPFRNNANWIPTMEVNFPFGNYTGD